MPASSNTGAIADKTGRKVQSGAVVARALQGEVDLAAFAGLEVRQCQRQRTGDQAGDVDVPQGFIEAVGYAEVIDVMKVGG
jgi:hypothetical protein